MIGTGPEPVQYFIYITGYDNPQHKPFKEVITEAEGLSKDYKDRFQYSTDNIAGLPVYRTTDLPSAYGAESVIFTDSKDNYILLGFTPYSKKSPWPEQNRFYAIFNQILSTFKFLP